MLSIICNDSDAGQCIGLKEVSLRQESGESPYFAEMGKFGPNSDVWETWIILTVGLRYVAIWDSERRPLYLLLSFQKKRGVASTRLSSTVALGGSRAAQRWHGGLDYV